MRNITRNGIHLQYDSIIIMMMGHLNRALLTLASFVSCIKGTFPFRHHVVVHHQQRHHFKRHHNHVIMASISCGGGRVVVVGSINQDLTTYSNTLPAPGETLLGTDFVTSAGGKGANQAVAAASIGVVRRESGVHMIGRVGKDDMGRNLLRGLRYRGVFNDHTTMVEGAHTGVASINVCSSGQNTIIVAPGANLCLSAEEVDFSISSLLRSGGTQQDVVLVQLEIAPETALRALKAAKSKSALTILNPAPAPKGWELTQEWYSNIDILIPNERELASLCGVSEEEVTGEGEEAMASALLQRGVRRAVIVTLGERGAMIVRRRKDEKQSLTDLNYDDRDHETIMISEPSELPCKSLPVVDAVGAGDAFCGALSAYLSRGVGLERASSMACGVASMSVRKRGAQESYPLAQDLPECLKLKDTNQQSSAGEESEAEAKRGTLTFVTGNKNKLLEVQRLLSSDQNQPIPFDLDNAELDLPELQGSPEDIAREKCSTAANLLQTAVITEDTSLCFHALNGLPGPYIKWFLDNIGHDGLNKMLRGFDDERAYAQTIIAFSAGPGKDVHLFDGRTKGRIVSPRGALDFGWDPIFQPEREECIVGGIVSDNDMTYAEMTKDDKNKISHRSRAFVKFRQFLSTSAEQILRDMKC
jgi:ribokinase/non-canonical purine NTP pyrophosphatase (RdgB/HAM1 family)